MNSKTNLILLFSILPFFTFGQDDCTKPNGTSSAQWNDFEITFSQGGSFIAPEINFDAYNTPYWYSLGLCFSANQEGGYKSAVSTPLSPLASPSTDFWAGPLNSSLDPTIRGTAFGEEYCQNFDRFWTINKAEVLSHRQDWDDNGSIDNNVADNILEWPGQGNPEFEGINGWILPDEDMAPFVDRNDNGIYEPMSGDYPAIRGDWNIWKIINDAGNIHTESNGDKFKMELSIMFYAFESDDSTISKTFYTDIELRNDNSTKMDSLVISLFTNHSKVDQQIVFQDGVGCNPAENYSFAYGLGEDSSSPSHSMLIIQKILTEEEQVDKKFSHFTYCANPAEDNPPSIITDPSSVIEYTRYMSGEWRDGSPLTFGGNGYAGQTPTDFAFPDNPTDPNGWSMCSEDLPKYNYRAFTSSLAGTVLPGAVRRFSYSTTFLTDYGVGCPDFAEMNEVSDKVEDVWDENEMVTSLINFSLDNQLKVFPNPFHNELDLSIDNEQIKEVEIYSITGQSILRQEHLSDSNITLEFPKEMASGLYFVKAKTENGASYIQKIVKQ